MHRILGLAVAGERAARPALRGGRAVASAALAPAALAWRSPAAAPLHRRAEQLGGSLDQDGRELVERVRRLVGDVSAPLVTELAAWLAEEQLMELAIVELIARGTAARVADQIVRATLHGQVLDEGLVDEVTAELLASDEMQRVVEHVSRSPEVRAALASQGAGLASEMATGMRRRTSRADDAAERLARLVSRRPRQ